MRPRRALMTPPPAPTHSNAAIAGRVIAVGAGVGFTGLALFAGLHALVIKPVWSDLAEGIPFVLAIGITVAWAYHEFVKAAPARACATGGLRFGALMWLSAWPATALANVMRLRLDSSLPFWVDVTAFVLALAGGALALWLVTRSRRAAIAGAVAAAVLLATGGGPLPVVRGGRVVELWFGLLVLECLGGVALAMLYRRFVAPLGATASALR